MRQGVGCGSFAEENPKNSKLVLCARLDPLILKKELRKRPHYDELLEKSVKGFIKLLIRESI